MISIGVFWMICIYIVESSCSGVRCEVCIRVMRKLVMLLLMKVSVESSSV